MLGFPTNHYNYIVVVGGCADDDDEASERGGGLATRCTLNKPALPFHTHSRADGMEGECESWVVVPALEMVIVLIPDSSCTFLFC